MSATPTPRPVERIHVACCARDAWFASLCVTSIRQWYPDLPITLIKDLHQGDFDTTDLEAAWDVSVWDTPVREFGWGFSKLEPLFGNSGERFLLLDADIVFAGPVLERLNAHAEDFVVSPHPLDMQDEATARDYFTASALLALDPGYRYPGFVFNTGQFVATAGVLRRQDFNGLIEWSEPRKLLRPDIFACAEQGVLNYRIARHTTERGVSLGREEFMCWSEWRDGGGARLDRIAGSGYPFLIHWAGPDKHRKPLQQLTRSDILEHFQRIHVEKLRSREAEASTTTTGSLPSSDLEENQAE